MATNLYDTGIGAGLFAQPKRKQSVLGAPADPYATAAAQPAAQGTAPIAPTSPFGSPVGPTPLHPLAQVSGGVRGQARNVGSLYANNTRRANPYLWSALQQLLGQANTNRMSDANRAAFLGPHEDALQNAFGQQQNALSRSLSERGLGDSSGMAAGLGALGSGEAAAHAGLVSNLYQSEDQRQLQAQDQLRSLLMALSGQGAQGAGILGNIRSGDLQQQQLDQANQFDWGGLLSSLLGAGGSFLGAGGLGMLGGMFGGGGAEGDPVQNPAIYKTGWSNYA